MHPLSSVASQWSHCPAVCMYLVMRELSILQSLVLSPKKDHRETWREFRDSSEAKTLDLSLCKAWLPAPTTFFSGSRQGSGLWGVGVTKSTAGFLRRPGEIFGLSWALCSEVSLSLKKILQKVYVSLSPGFPRATLLLVWDSKSELFLSCKSKTGRLVRTLLGHGGTHLDLSDPHVLL